MAVVNKLGYWGFLCNEALCKAPQKLANRVASAVMAYEKVAALFYLSHSSAAVFSPAVEGVYILVLACHFL